ncbi:retrovirus-related Pol polyprotein from transposon TNT 1-94 [Trichonephila clavipes]|nr:retrovirus-related Pol polyprotein from transposon TNT 1-94 [Trichonephila clavipes]
MEKSPQQESWRREMDEEFNDLKLKNVWKLTKLPPDKQLLGCRWVYNLKRDENGKVIRYKARLVAQVWLKWKHFQCDVTGAYLYAPLNEEVYMKQPQGYIEKGKEGLVCKLKQALYGLQSGRAWYFELNNVLNEIGLQKLNWCNCTYFFRNSIVLLVYVDDIVIFGQTEKDIDYVLIKLKGKFNLKIMGKTKRLLGVEFEETDECMLIHQIPYIDEIYKKYKHLNIPISSLPIAKGIQYSKRQCPQSNDEKIEMKEIPYRNVLGCLSFLAGRTRPDVSYAVNIFSQFQNDPGLDHWYGLC